MPILDLNPNVGPALAPAHVRDLLDSPITVWTLDGDEAPPLRPVLATAAPFGELLDWDRCRTIAADQGARLHYLVAFAADEPVGVFPLAELRSSGGSRLLSFPSTPLGGPVCTHPRAEAALRGRAQRLAATRSVATIQVARLRLAADLPTPPAAPAWIVVKRDRLRATSCIDSAPGPVLQALGLRAAPHGQVALIEPTADFTPAAADQLADLASAVTAQPEFAHTQWLAFAGRSLAPAARQQLLKTAAARVSVSELIW